MSQTNNHHLLQQSFFYTWTIADWTSQYSLPKKHNDYDDDDDYVQETIYSEHFPLPSALTSLNQLGVQFYLELVPGGEDEQCQDYVSAFLYLASCVKQQIMIRYKFWIINKHGQVCNVEGIIIIVNNYLYYI